MVLSFPNLGRSSSTVFNPARDVRPFSAPDLGKRLNFNDSDFIITGKTMNFGSYIPPKSVTEYPASDVYDYKFLLSNQNRLVAIYSGGAFEYVNDTHAFVTYFDFFHDPIIPVCYKVSNYSYDNYIHAWSTLQRVKSYSAELDVAILVSNIAKNLYNHSNRSCELFYGYSTIDIYRGQLIDELSAPGPVYGAQKAPTIMEVEIPRAISECYGNFTPIYKYYEQFYPLLSAIGIDKDNIVKSNIMADEIRQIVSTDLSFFTNFINTLCQGNPPEYNTFYNSDCPYPSLPNIQCS